jgi:two-component system NarL family sensor kinase
MHLHPLQDPGMRIKYLSTLFILLSLAAVPRAGNAVIDSLEKALRDAAHDSTRVKILSDISWEYSFSDLIKAESYASKELELATALNKPAAIAQGYNDIGIIQYKKGNLNGALENYQRSYEIRIRAGDKPGMASSLSKIGVTLYELGNYKEALKAQLEALKLFEALDHKMYVAYTLNNLGQLYQRLHDYDKSIEYSQRSYDYCEQIGDKHGMATSIGNVGFIYEIKKDYAKAIEYDLKALALFEELGDKPNLSNILNNIGFLYRSKGDNQTGLTYYQKALQISRELDDKSGIALYTTNIANIYSDLGQYPLSEKNYKDAQRIAEAQNNKPVLKNIYRGLATLYNREKNYKGACDYLELYSTINDSLYSEESTKQIAEMQTKYETEKKEAEIALLKQEQKITNLEIKQNQLRLNQRRTQIFVLIGTFSFLLILGFLFYNRYKLKQKQLRNEEMLRQEKLRTKAIIGTQEAERKRIAEELHDGIGQMLSAVKLNVAALEGSTAKETQLHNAIELIDDSCRELRNISHNMMPGILVKAGLIPALKEYASKISDSGALNMTVEADHDLSQRMDEATEINLFRIIQELVNNIIKYARATEVQVSLNKTDEGISVMIEDNGQGFDKNVLMTSAGNGWSNINSRLDLLNGKIEIDSSPGKGTALFIEIPQLITV